MEDGDPSSLELENSAKTVQWSLNHETSPSSSRFHHPMARLPVQFQRLCQPRPQSRSGARDEPPSARASGLIAVSPNGDGDRTELQMRAVGTSSLGHISVSAR